MKKVILTLCLFAFSNVSLADYATGQRIEKIYSSATGEVRIRTESQPSNTCSYYGWYFTFDSTTDGGKSLLSLILAAKATDSTLEIWYTTSLAPGTDETNGCYNNLAVLTGASLY